MTFRSLLNQQSLPSRRADAGRGNLPRPKIMGQIESSGNVAMVTQRPDCAGRLRSRGMFEDEGNALPVIRVFDRWTRGKVTKGQAEGG